MDDLPLIERARYLVAKRLAEQRAATYLIPGYLRGELDDSLAINMALRELAPETFPEQIPAEHLHAYQEGLRAGRANTAYDDDTTMDNCRCVVVPKIEDDPA